MKDEEVKIEEIETSHWVDIEGGGGTQLSDIRYNIVNR